MNEQEPPFVTETTEDGVEVRRYEFTIKSVLEDARLDSYLATRFPDYSRTFIKKLIDENGILVNEEPVKPAYSPKKGDHVLCLVPVVEEDYVPPEDIPLDIIYEDDYILVVNKPADMVVHPSRGHQSGTLVNAVAYHCQDLSEGTGPLRPGIVHRLDRDTSGAIMVVKDNSVHQELARQFHDREVKKEYLAVCEGMVDLDSDLIDAPIGNHVRHKEKMAIRWDEGKTARTVYEVEERLGRFTVVHCFPRSGRTHQIRVHMQHLGHPIVADPKYGHRNRVYMSDIAGGEHHPAQEPVLERQALHALRLSIHHPVLDKDMTFEAKIPSDIKRFIELLREHVA